jgi:RNA polymerase sigma-70 factor (ECF subfamily)
MIDRWETDGELAAALRARDGDAWAVVYLRYASQMRAVARQLAPLGLADDVVHDVFARFWDRPDLFDPQRGSLRGYLLATTRSQSIDAVREDVARLRRQAKHLDSRRSSPAPSAEADALAAVTTEQLIIAIRMLPRGEREAIGLAYFRHLPYQEVARVLGLPEGTVKSRIRAGLARMRLALVELGQDPGPSEQTSSPQGPLTEAGFWSSRGRGPGEGGHDEPPGPA